MGSVRSMGRGGDEGLDVLRRGYGVSDSFPSLYALKACALFFISVHMLSHDQQYDGRQRSRAYI